MDWLSGTVESEEFVVVTDEDLLDMFQSPDSWPPWGVSESESFSTYYTSIEKNNQEMVFEEEKGEISIQESEQSISSTVIPDFQFNDHLTRRDHMDDLFWGSILGLDMIETGNNNTSFRLSSEPQFGLNPAIGGGITDLIVDSQTGVRKGTSIGIIDNPVEKLFQYSSYGIPNGQHHESNGSVWFNGEQVIPEELLFELGRAMKRLPESTRLCFRDYFYRCSYNSIQHSPLLQADDERIRSSSEQTWIATSGTDMVDKVVATFMCS